MYDDIDIVRTIVANLARPHEKEIRLKEGAHIQIVSIILQDALSDGTDAIELCNNCDFSIQITLEP